MTGERHNGYAPALDGVRALAVTLVVVHHSGLDDYGLGGAGVTVFFGLSGYLITGLLVDEHTRAGAVDLRRFYLRRGARLIPALLAVVLVADLAFAALGATQPIAASLLALTYTTNYATAATGHILPGFGHAWSLSIEEHFYLLWPIALLALRRRLTLRGCLAATLALCVADIAWRVLLLQAGASSYFVQLGSLERADALLYGCAAAVAVRLGWTPAHWVAPAAASVFIGYHLAGTPATPVVGSAIQGAAVAAFVAAIHHSTNPALTNPAALAIGKRSYGIYLWHTPTLAALFLAGVTGWTLTASALAATIAAAWTSYRWIETPVREWASRQTGRSSSPTPSAECSRSHSASEPTCSTSRNTGRVSRSPN